MTRSLYTRDGASRLQSHLRQFAHYAGASLTELDLIVTGAEAVKATAAQWALVQELRALVPDATVNLRVHTLAWKTDRQAPTLTFVRRCRDAQGWAVHASTRMRATRQWTRDRQAWRIPRVSARIARTGERSAALTSFGGIGRASREGLSAQKPRPDRRASQPRHLLFCCDSRIVSPRV